MNGMTKQVADRSGTGPWVGLPLRVALPVIVGAMVLSGVVVLLMSSLVIDVGKLSSDDRRATGMDAAQAAAFLAAVTGLATASVAGGLARWYPSGLFALGCGVIGIGAYLTSVAFTEKPALAPMFFSLYIVFVAAYGFAIPYLAHRERKLHDEQLATRRE